MSFDCSADLMSLFGVKWSGMSTMRPGSKTFPKPAASNSWIAIGAVMSLPRAMSTSA